MRAGVTAVNIASVAVVAMVIGLAAPAAFAAGGGGKVEDYSFSFEGPFGRFDTQQLQRGLLVYQEVCAACHGLRYVPFRTLGDPGGPELPAGAIKAFAANFDIYDDELEDFRPATPVDNFPVVDSADAPDLSLMAKARAGFSGPEGTGLTQLYRGGGGPEYIASLLTHYTGEEKTEAGTTLYENESFPGGWLSMAPPLEDGIVEFPDGSSSSVEAMALDVAAFLTWTAEPKMMARKQAGFVGVLLLALLAALLYLTNKRLWASVKHRARE